MKTKEQYLKTYQKWYLFTKKFLVNLLIVELFFCVFSISADLVKFNEIISFKELCGAILLGFIGALAVSGQPTNSALEKKRTKIKSKIHDLKQDIFMLKEALKEKKNHRA